MRGALHGRVSTREKDQDPELQLQPMREYAAVRGWDVAEYVDRASAADLECSGQPGISPLSDDVPLEFGQRIGRPA